MPSKYLRKTGESARALSPDVRRRLREFSTRHAARLGVPLLSVSNLRSAMNAPFTWKTLLRALQGKTIRADNCEFIEAFVNRHVPGRAAASGQRDFKSLASGSRSDECEIPPEIADPVDGDGELARTHRGSR